MIGIRPVALEHAAAVQLLASDPAIGATSNVPSPYPPDGAETFIRATILKRARGEEYAFAVMRDVEVVGMCGLVALEADPKALELGYWIGKPFWGRGYATAAGRLLLQFGFDDLHIGRIVAWCLVSNPASRRVLEKLGFNYIGIRPHERSKWGPDEPLAHFELTVVEWQRAGRAGRREEQGERGE